MEVLFHETAEIDLFQKQTCEVCSEPGLDGSTITEVFAMIKPGAAPNLIRTDFLQQKWRNAVRTTIKRPWPKSASGNALQMNVVITLFIKMRGNIALVWFVVIDEFEVIILSGTWFIDRFNGHIFLMEWRVVPVQSKSVWTIFVIKHA